MTINSIGKETLKKLAHDRTPLTPENYQKAFCEIAKKRGVRVDECETIKRFTSKLNPTLQNELSKYKASTTGELLTYLVSTLNRISSNGEGKLSLTLISLIKRLLKVLSLLHNKDARELAHASLERVEHLADQKSFEIIEARWENFIDSYDDSFLDDLTNYIDLKSKDYETVVKCLLERVKECGGDENLDEIATIIIASLTPSIATNMDDELSAITYELKTTPKLLKKKAFQEELKLYIRNRVTQDKKEVQRKLKSIDELLSSVSQKLVNFIEKSAKHQGNIKSIKDELSSLDFSQHSFEMTRERLLALANSLELEAGSLGESVKSEDSEIKRLKMKVKKLEDALRKVKKESKKDFLTTLLNKRGLDEELNRVEKGFERYGIEYSIVFFDIDKFKMINDTFGHEAGDEILKQVGKILKSKKRDTDIIGRYGGEEFLAILPKTSLSGAITFANKIREEVERFDFLYKGEKIAVTLSGGVGDRKFYKSQKELIEVADSELYKSKEAGRNRIYPQNG